MIGCAQVGGAGDDDDEEEEEESEGGYSDLDAVSDDEDEAITRGKKGWKAALSKGDAEQQMMKEIEAVCAFSLPLSLFPALPGSLSPWLSLSLAPWLPLSLALSLPHSLSPSLPLLR
jgi:hypothetical protein